MNAVDAVINLLDNEKPFWKIFCMGNTTKKLVIKYFGEESLIATGINATDLANAIVEFQHSRFVTSRTDIENDTWLFFCGDQRRDELPGILNSNNISPTEIIVYKTIETSQEVEKYYDAILFFSPSAVHSFFKNNQADVATTFFAIGETTATAIKKYSSNTIITGNTPAKDELFKHCIHQLELQAELNTGNQ
jgi:uroporphyrinogen-III synthase